ncbi:MAG: restriction endonuclease subunit S [Dokdonella sp.]|nr:restriction endonuclease subunit S [Dokdonella sp.]
MKLFPDHWKTDSVSELCTDVVDCVNKTAPVVDGPTEYKMIRTTNVKAGRINLDDCRYVDEATFVKWTRRIQPKRNDIVLTREAPLGEVGLLRSDEPVFLGQRTMLYRANPEKLDQRFLYYSMLGPLVQGQIRSQGSGATVEHLRVPDAESFLVAYPPLDEQRRIAALLSAYDDLIANNQRRIALLESMAEEIYREWFARMRFPGYETAEHERGIPSGWQASTAAVMVHVQGGGTPSTEVGQYWGGEIPFFSPKDSHDGAYCLQTEQSITELGLENCASRLFPKDTIFITARGTVGNLVLAGQPMAMNQSCYALVPKIDKKPYFVFAGLRCAVNVIKGISNSGVFDNVVMDTFKIIPLIDPGDALRDRYNEVAGPIYEQSLMLRRANSHLCATRDALLPRLISGKLRVEALDIQFPPSMQQPPTEAAQRGEAIAR